MTFVFKFININSIKMNIICIRNCLDSQEMFFEIIFSVCFNLKYPELRLFISMVNIVYMYF